MNKDNFNRKELAKSLYMKGYTQEDIAQKIGVSTVTVSNWANAETWKEQRAAKSVTRQELVNKILQSIDTLITQANASNDPQQITSIGMELAKLSIVIERLDKKSNIVDIVEAFIAFSSWLEKLAITDAALTPALLKTINSYQDQYITEMLNK